MPTISTSQNLTAVSYTAGEAFTINAGVTLTINSTPALRLGTATNNGTILVDARGVGTPFTVPFTDNTAHVNNYSGSWEVYGDPYVIGTSNGTASQTFTSPFPVGTILTAIEVETGNGTNVYEFWHNISTAGQALSTVNNQTILGRVFTQTTASTTITFGDGTNGRIPANGARIRCPNVMLAAMTTGGAYTINNAALSQVRFGTSLGAFVFSRCCLSGFFVNPSSPKSITLTNSIAGLVNITTPSAYSIGNIVAAIQTTTIGTASAFGLRLSGLRDVTLTNLQCINSHGTASIPSIFIEECINVILDSPICRMFRTSGAGGSNITISRSTNCRIDDPVLIGQGFSVILSSRSTITGTQYSDTNNAALSTTNAANLLSLTNNGSLSFDGLTLFGSPFYGSLVSWTISSQSLDRTIIRNIGSPTSIIDAQNHTLNLSNNTAGSTVIWKDIFIQDFRNASPFTTFSATQGSRFLNCLITSSATNYSSTVPLSSIVGTDFLAYYTTTAFAATWSNSRNTNFYLAFTSATAATAGIVFNEITNTSLYQVVAGSPVFNGSGGVSLVTSDQLIVSRNATNYPVYGCTQLTTLNITGTSTGNCTVEYRLSADGNFLGAWKTSANLPESVSATTGFYEQYRLTATGSCTITGVNFTCTTSSSDQQAVSYPILDVVPISLSGAPPTANVLIQRVSGYSQLFLGVSDGSGIYSTNYAYDIDTSSISVRIRSRKAGFSRIESLSQITVLGMTAVVAYTADSFSDASGASITGISVSTSGASVTGITLTASRSFTQIHNYIASYLASNLTIDDFESFDGSSLNINANFTLSGSGGITGSQTLALGESKTLTLSNAGTYTFAANIPASGFVVVNGDTSIVNFNSSGATISSSTPATVTVSNTSDWTAGANVALVSPTAQIIFSGLLSGSEVRVFNIADNSELGGIESSSTSFSVNYSGTPTVRYIIIKQGYYLIEEELALPGTDITVPVFQRVDRVFSNP